MLAARRSVCVCGEVVGVAVAEEGEGGEDHAEVVAHRVFGGVGIAAGDGFEDQPVLAEHLVEVAGLREAESADAVEVAADAADECPGDGVSAEVGQRSVEFFVEYEPAGVVLGCADVVLAGDDRAQRGDVLFLGVGGGFADGGAFEGFADEVGVGDGGLADRGDERSELGDDLDQAVVAEPDERLADGGSADAEAGGELVLRELSSGLEFSGDDRVPEEVVRLTPAGAATSHGSFHTCMLYHTQAPQGALWRYFNAPLNPAAERRAVTRAGNRGCRELRFAASARA